MSRFVTLGEVMIRLSTPDQLRFQQAMPGELEVHFGGAESSVAALLAQWGASASFVTALPDQPLGRACAANLRSLGVGLDQTQMTQAGRLGVYFVEHGADHRSGQVIYDRDHSSFSVTPPEAYDWEAIFAGADWFVMTGITPAISRNGYELAKRALMEAKTRGIQIACDMNYRSKLWRWDASKEPGDLAAAVMKELLFSIDLLVCGRSDAQQTLGMEGGESEEDLMRQIAEEYPNLKRVICTKRESVSSSVQRLSASLYDVGTQTCFQAPTDRPYYEVGAVVDRVGSGDAMLGALLYALESSEWSEPGSALSLAVATGCLAHSIVGDICYVTRQEAEELVREGSAGRIRR